MSNLEKAYKEKANDFMNKLVLLMMLLVNMHQIK